MHTLIRLIALCSFPFISLCAAHYYIDASGGNDAASGTSAGSAWRTLERVNKVKLKPGDRVLLKSGEVFKGQFRVDDSGKRGKPIRLLSYGQGPKPIIAAEGKFRSAVHLNNVEYWIVEGIEITNKGPERAAKRIGLLITADKGGVFNDITIRNNTVRDVNGVFSKNAGGGAGICWEISNRKKRSRINGLLIENNHLYRCDRDAIRGWMAPWSDLSNLSTNVVIRRNLLEDIGGDGIVPIGMDGALVEYNRLYGFRKRIPGINEDKEVSMNAGASIGIWPWSSKNTHIRFNEVWGYEGTFDGQGLDSDFNCDGTLFEYNLSANNKGGFFLICNNSKLQESGESIGNSNTRIRHNISLNDHVRGFVLNGPVSNVQVDGNIIYNTIEDEFQLVIDTPWEKGHFAHSASFTNNVFYTTGVATITQGNWHPSGLGLWESGKPINRESIHFEGNAYSNVKAYQRKAHKEPKMQRLRKKETLSSLLDRFRQNREAREGFDQLLRFLKESRYRDQVEKAL